MIEIQEREAALNHVQSLLDSISIDQRASVVGSRNMSLMRRSSQFLMKS